MSTAVRLAAQAALPGAATGGVTAAILPARELEWDGSAVEHLWSRAGFGVPDGEIDGWVEAGPEALVDARLAHPGEPATFDRGEPPYDRLGGILRDPAMRTYLNNDENWKGRPNENLARDTTGSCSAWTPASARCSTTSVAPSAGVRRSSSSSASSSAA